MTKTVTKKQAKKSKCSKTSNQKNVIVNTTKNTTMVTQEVTINVEETTNYDLENRSISTPISTQLNKDNCKMISYAKVKYVLDMFTNSFVEYGKHLYSKYNQENDNQEYEKLMKKSYLRNVRFLLNPTWIDMNHEYDYPNYQTFDELNNLFYMIPEEKQDSWVFQGVQTFNSDSQLNDTHIYDAFEALINGVYHTEFMTNNDRSYYYFTYYFDMLKYILDKKNNDYTQNLYHIGSLLQINDGQSSLYQPYSNLEACITTKNMVMMINSLTILKRKNILNALDSIGLEDTDIRLFINQLLTPFFGILYAFRRLDIENDILEIDRNVYTYQCVSKPHSSWIDEDEDFDYEAYRKEKEEAIRLQKAKRALEEEARRAELDSIPIVTTNAPLIQNKRFVQEQLEEERVKNSPTASINSRASAFIDGNSTVHSPTTTNVSDKTNKYTYVPPDFVFEENKIPKSLKRSENNETVGRDTGFLIFHSGTASDHVYERRAISTHSGKYKCSVKDVCTELPRLLVEKEKVLRKSRDKAFGRSFEELFNFDVKNRKLYYTNLRRAMISFCNEIAATHRHDNQGRMAILEKYYGPRKDDETEKMYIDAFMSDVFKSFINFYNYAKTL